MLTSADTAAPRPRDAHLQAERHFLLLDNSSGIQIYTYDGRQICNPKFQVHPAHACTPAPAPHVACMPRRTRPVQRQQAEASGRRGRA
jgi:hypothetical protein